MLLLRIVSTTVEVMPEVIQWLPRLCMMGGSEWLGGVDAAQQRFKRVGGRGK